MTAPASAVPAARTASMPEAVTGARPGTEDDEPGSATQLDVDAALGLAVERVALVAQQHAASADTDARFPIEAVDALRAEQALSALIPVELGGGGASFTAVAAACYQLGRHCSATAMVFAMHQIQIATLVRHCDDVPWFRSYLRSIATEQRLIASVTSEVGIGGDMGRSAAALTPVGGQFTFTKQAPTISYGHQADDLLTTLRRHPSSEPGDQVLVISTRDQTHLEPTGTWDTLGMRGTCSPGFVVSATVGGDQVVPVPFQQVSAETVVPVSHLLWAHVWWGIATAAFDRARAFARAAATRNGSPGVAGQKLSKLSGDLTGMGAQVQLALRDFVRASEEPGRPQLNTMSAALRYNTLKITASESAADVCLGCLRVTGFPGYLNTTPFSVGRQLRDSLSAAAMVANDRLHDSNAALLMVVKDLVP